MSVVGRGTGKWALLDVFHRIRSADAPSAWHQLDDALSDLMYWLAKAARDRDVKLCLKLLSSGPTALQKACTCSARTLLPAWLF